MITTLLASATFIIWFLIISTIIVIVSLETENEGVASTFFSLAIALLLWNYGSDILSFVNENLTTTISFIVGYVLVGLGWSFLKWNEKVKKVFNKFVRLKTEFLKNGGVITENNKQDFNGYINREFKDGSGDSISISRDFDEDKIFEAITPKGNDYKALIVSWISYWPLSLVGTLLNNPFRRFFEYVYESVSGCYDEIAKKQKNKILNIK